MTNNQRQLAQETLKQLQALAPKADWHMTYNHYTKLPEFQALKEGGVEFSMYKQEGDRKNVTNEYGVTYPHYTHRPHAEITVRITNAHVSGTGFIVSNGLPPASRRHELPRVNFKAYCEYVKQNLDTLRTIGA